MKITVDVLKKVAVELNETLNPDPPIKITSRSSAADLTQEIKSTLELLEKGDSISSFAMDVFSEMEIDIPSFVKIKGGKSEKKETSPEKKESAPKKTVEKKTSGPSLKEELEKLIKEKKYTPQEIKSKLFKIFPDKKPSTITTILSDCKSEKWTPYGKTAVVDKKGVMKFS